MHRYLLAIAALAMSSISCNSDAAFDLVTFAETGEVPVVTGVYVTTFDQPEGTGEIIGTPAYELSLTSVNVFPNPFVQPDVIRRGDPWAETGYPKFPVLARIPGNVTIVIAAARYGGVSSLQTLGTSVPVKPHVVRVIRKTDPSQYFTWDLKDDNFNPVPTGAYRIYVLKDGTNTVQWVDLSVKRGRMFLEIY